MVTISLRMIIVRVIVSGVKLEAEAAAVAKLPLATIEPESGMSCMTTRVDISDWSHMSTG